MKKLAYYIFVGLGSLLFFPSCNPAENNDNEQELISKVSLTFADITNKTSTFVWNDPDGDTGTQKSTVDTIRLSSNSVYSTTIKIENSTVSPATNLTTEVQNESTAHLFVYSFDKTNMKIEITDKDTNAAPLGIATKFTTTSAGNGVLRVQLKHQPTDKNNTTNPGGETDIDVEFPVIIK